MGESKAALVCLPQALGPRRPVVRLHRAPPHLQLQPVDSRRPVHPRRPAQVRPRLQLQRLRRRHRLRPLQQTVPPPVTLCLLLPQLHPQVRTCIACLLLLSILCASSRESAILCHAFCLGRRSCRLHVLCTSLQCEWRRHTWRRQCQRSSCGQPCIHRLSHNAEWHAHPESQWCVAQQITLNHFSPGSGPATDGSSCIASFPKCPLRLRVFALGRCCSGLLLYLHHPALLQGPAAGGPV